MITRGVFFIWKKQINRFLFIVLKYSELKGIYFVSSIIWSGILYKNFTNNTNKTQNEEVRSFCIELIEFKNIKRGFQ